MYSKRISHKYQIKKINNKYDSIKKLNLSSQNLSPKNDKESAQKYTSEELIKIKKISLKVQRYLESGQLSPLNDKIIDKKIITN